MYTTYPEDAILTYQAATSAGPALPWSQKAVAFNSAGPDQRAARRASEHLPEAPQAYEDMEWVTGVGRTKASPGEAYSMPCHPPTFSGYEWRTGRVLPEYQLILLREASGEFESDITGHVRLSGDVLLFLFPGVWHRYRPTEVGGWTERWVSFKGAVVKERLAIGGVNPGRAVAAPRDAASLACTFDGFLDKVQRSSCNASRQLLPAALDLLGDAISQTTSAKLNTNFEYLMSPKECHINDEIVQNALEIIWNEKHSPPLSVSDVAKRLPVTRRTLDRRFSEVLGRSVLDEINSCRFARAKRLLAESDLPVKSVAYLAGYPSRERMRVMFIEREGLPPSEFREKRRANHR